LRQALRKAARLLNSRPPGASCSTQNVWSAASTRFQSGSHLSDSARASPLWRFDSRRLVERRKPIGEGHAQQGFIEILGQVEL
jgi:hypothetical protein